jgi:hypothetical protein
MNAYTLSTLFENVTVPCSTIDSRFRRIVASLCCIFPTLIILLTAGCSRDGITVKQVQIDGEEKTTAIDVLRRTDHGNAFSLLSSITAAFENEGVSPVSGCPVLSEGSFVFDEIFRMGREKRYSRWIIVTLDEVNERYCRDFWIPFLLDRPSIVVEAKGTVFLFDFSEERLRIMENVCGSKKAGCGIRLFPLSGPDAHVPADPLILERLREEVWNIMADAIVRNTIGTG